MTKLDLTKHEGFLTPEECKKFIKQIDNYLDHLSSVGIKPTRDPFSIQITNIEIKNRVERLVGFPIGEPLAIQKYSNGGSMAPHVDLWRFKSSIIYLNDDFEDGATTFYFNDGSKVSTEVKPGTLYYWNNGDGINGSRHSGDVVKSGSKYILSAFWREDPVGFAHDVINMPQDEFHGLTGEEIGKILYRMGKNFSHI